eukprot:3255057-Amphidinium_carterae.1
MQPQANALCPIATTSEPVQGVQEEHQRLQATFVLLREASLEIIASLCLNQQDVLSKGASIRTGGMFNRVVSLYLLGC